MKNLVLLILFICNISLIKAQSSLSSPATLSDGSISVNLSATTVLPGSGSNDLQVQNSVANKRTQLTIAPSGTSTAAFLNVINGSDPFNAGFGRLGVRGEYAAFSIQNLGTPTTSLKHFVVELDPSQQSTDESFLVTTNAFNVTGSPTVLCKVNGSGLSTIEAKVEATVAPPDYVFESDYALRSLNEVENYINENGHLPEIPSAAEFNEEGIKLGKMSFDLLKKVEELTLYMIAMKKENEALKERISALEKK